MRDRTALVVLVILTIIVVALSIGSVRMDSATSDEPAHIAAGMIKLQLGRLDFFREQPPLMNSISVLPVLAAGYDWPRAISPTENHWVAGRRFLWRSGNDGNRILFLARLPTVAVFIGLCWAMFFFVRWATANPWCAVLAFALTAFSPTMIAHGRLATVDMAMTAFGFVAAAAMLRLIEKPSVSMALVLGVASSAAVLSKISGLILGPYFVIVLALAIVFRRIREPKRFALMIGVALVAAVVLFEVVILATASHEYIGNANRLTFPITDYLGNVRTISKWYTKGHALPQFMLGDFSYSSWPQYYLIAYLLKDTIPAVLLAIFAVVIGAMRWKNFNLVALIAFVVLFLAFAARGKLALGIRYALPMFPFLYAAAAIALAEIHREVARKGMVMVIASLLVVWHAGEAIAAYPRYISYFNEFIGSDRNADRFLIDSNLDWGQDLRRLDAWCAANGVKEISVHYFGGSDVVYDMRHAKPIVRYMPGPDRLPKGWFALSRHFYRVSFMPGLWPVDYDAYLEACGAKYVTTIGGSIYVYRVE